MTVDDCVSMVGNTLLTGTTIVAYRTPDFVAVGVDSRIFMPGTEAHHTGCKIAQIGNFFVTGAGVLLDIATGYSILATAKKASEGGGSLIQIADRYEEMIQRSLTATMQKLKQDQPEYFNTYCEGKNGPNTVFAGFENNAPVLAVRSFSAETTNGHVHMTPSPRLNCPGNCPGPRVDITLGCNENANKILADTPDFWSRNDVFGGMRKLISAEAAANSKFVALPISVVRIDRNGPIFFPTLPPLGQ